MKCSVYIATSADGYIAKLDGNIDWLHTTGNLHADMGDQADMGWPQYMSSIDCIIMGRKTMQSIDAMNLTPEQWPYGNTKIIVLSNTIKQPPANLKEKIEIYSGDIKNLITKLENQGHKHAYVDGGKTITSFLNLNLINEITITQLPIILGQGIPLFNNTKNQIQLKNPKTKTFPNDLIQIKYHVNNLT